MAEFPALPIFTDAYLGDTRHLTAAQHGAYLLLLMTAWRTTECALPDDDRQLARWAAMDYRTWLNNRDVVMALWTKGDDHKWRQRRLSDERKRAENVRDRNVRAGKSSALKRKQRHVTVVAPTPNEDTTPSPSPSPSVSESSSEASDRRSRPKHATRLAENWEPPPEYIDYALSHGLTHTEAIQQAETMRDWSLSSPNGAKLDWLATWRGWIKRYIAERKQNARPQSQRARPMDGWLAAIEESARQDPDHGGGGEASFPLLHPGS